MSDTVKNKDVVADTFIINYISAKVLTDSKPQSILLSENLLISRTVKRNC